MSKEPLEKLNPGDAHEVINRLSAALLEIVAHLEEQEKKLSAAEGAVCYGWPTCLAKDHLATKPSQPTELTSLIENRDRLKEILFKGPAGCWVSLSALAGVC